MACSALCLIDAVCCRRRLTISCFRDVLYVDMREWYQDKAGVDRPGKKGISLPPEQWHRLVLGLPLLDKAL